MASVYFGVGVGGEGPADVTIAASTTSSAVELVVNDASISRASVDGKEKIASALEAIKLALEEYAW